MLLLATAGCRGAAPAPPAGESAPAGETLPVSAERTAWRALLAWPEACDTAYEASRASDDSGITVTPLGGGRVFIQTLCANGAYQPSFVYGIVDARGAQGAGRVLAFPAVESPDGTTLRRTTATELPGESWFSAARTELTVLNLWRQTADCGVWTRYDIGNGEPRLVEVRGRFPCPASPGEPARPVDGAAPAGWAVVDAPR